ncbi:MAG: hypothetical protein Kow0031_01500 [Anaerolineae bacterium]
MTTIEKAEKLTEYLKLNHRDNDPVVDSVLDKLLDRERQQLLKQSAELESELAQFEQQYGMASPEFCVKFENGELGDNLDFVDWLGAWRVYQTVQNSLGLLPIPE